MNNIQPRLGFAYQINDRTVVRGGAGRYYGDVLTNLQMWTYGNESIASVEVNNDGRPDFPSNPFNGVKPTATQAFANFCDINNRPGCLTRGLQELRRRRRMTTSRTAGRRLSASSIRSVR